MPASRIVSGSVTDNVPAPSVRTVTSPMLEAFLDLQVGQSFAGNWLQRNGVYATAKRFKKMGLLPPDYKITIQPDTEGVGTWRVYRLK